MNIRGFKSMYRLNSYLEQTNEYRSYKDFTGMTSESYCEQMCGLKQNEIIQGIEKLAPELVRKRRTDEKRFYIPEVWDILAYVISIVQYRKQSEKKVILVSGSKRIYWMFKIISYCLMHILKQDKRMYSIYSAEYIIKSLNKGNVKYKEAEVILLADEITPEIYETGLYDNVKRLKGISDIFIYSLYEDKDVKPLWAEDNVHFGVYANEGRSIISRVRVLILNRIIKEMHIPYTQNPIILIPMQGKASIGKGILKNKVYLEDDEFYSIKENNQGWKYVETTIEKSNNEISQGFFFNVEKALELYMRGSEFIGCMTVKMQSRKLSNGKWEVSFTPAVVTKYIDVRNLLLYYLKLNRKDEQCKKKMQRYIKTQGEENTISQEMYTALHQAVVYRLNIFTWLQFEYDVIRKAILGEPISWRVNYQLEEDFWEKTFINVNRQEFNRLSKIVENGGIELLGEENIYLTEPSEFNRHTDNEKPSLYEEDIEKKPLFSYKKSTQFVYEQLMKIKFTDIEVETGRSVINKNEIELQEYVGDRYSFIDVVQAIYEVVRLCFLYLDNGIVSEKLKYEGRYVSSIYTYGAYFDISFLFEIRLFYSGVLAYYNKIIEKTESGEEVKEADQENKGKDVVQEAYTKNIDIVMEYIVEYIEENAPYRILVSDYDIRRAKYYFKVLLPKMGDINYHMENKHFMSTGLLEKILYRYIYIQF